MKTWVENHETWSLATRRNVIAIILAAFNHAQAMHDVQQAQPFGAVPDDTSRGRVVVY